MILERLLGRTRSEKYPGPLHVVERRHRDGTWLPVALGIRARSQADALRKYRECLPSGVWKKVTFRARIQAQSTLEGGLGRGVSH